MPSKIEYLIVVDDESLDAAIAVVDDLAGRMERDLGSRDFCESISLRLVLDDQPLDVASFFDRFEQEDRMEAAAPLRRLMLAYLNNIEGGEGCLPWHYEGHALHALRALVLLDAGAHDVYRLYLDKGDIEHDAGPYELHAEYLERHGARNEADIRFGIYLTMTGFRSADVDPVAVLEAAEGHVSARRFADLVIEEEKTVAAKSGAMGEEYVHYLTAANPTDFSEEVIKLLQSAF